jgi:hypothetical protein
MIQAVTVLIKNVFILLIFVGDLREKGRWLKGILDISTQCLRIINF